jgi:outer membrane protein TolC
MKKYIITLFLAGLSLTGLSSEDLNLADYMRLVENNSKDLKSAEIDQKLAGVQTSLASSAARPIISASAGYARNFIDIDTVVAYTATDPDGSGTSYLNYVDYPYNYNNEFTAALGVQQTLFSMKVFKAIEASRKYAELTGTIYEATRQAILTAAKQLYYQTVLLEEVYKVKKATEENAYENYLYVKKRFDNEIASELEVLQAEVNWQINIPETTKSARNRDLALSSLKHLAGIDLNRDIILTESLGITPEKENSDDMGMILGNRPDFMALQGELDLREINISAKKGDFYPTLVATFGIGTSITHDDFSLEDGTEYAQLALTLTVPVYYGGSRFAQLKQARLEKEKSYINLLKKQDEIRTEINNLNLLLDEASSRIISAETTVETAEKAFNIMSISSKNGMATQLDLKDASLNLAGAKLNYYSSIYDYLNAYFSWQQAVGEGDILPF